MMLIVALVTLFTCKKMRLYWAIFKYCVFLCLLFDIIYASLTFILTIRKICRNWERRKSFFLLFFGDGSSIVEWYRRSYRKCLCFLCCRHKSGLLPTSFLKSTLLFLTFLMRKHTVLIDGFLSLKIQFQQLFMRLRDVTPSHITSLDVTPSEVRTLEVLIYLHYTFGKLHFRAVSPSEYYTLRSYIFRCFTLGTLQLRKITPSTVSEDIRRWKVQRCNFPKVKSPKV